MANPAWIVNAEPGTGPVPDKAIDIVLYGAGSGGGGPVGLDDVSGSLTIEGQESGVNTVEAWLEFIFTNLNAMAGQITDLQLRVEELESGGGDPV